MGRRRRKNKRSNRGERDTAQAELVRSAAKQKMMDLLAEHYGLTKNQSVQKAVQDLAKMSPTPQPTKSDLLLGHFVTVSSPQFPGRIAPADTPENDESVFQYTLGRLSFGLFEPRTMVCTLRQVHTNIEPLVLASSGPETTNNNTAEEQVDTSYNDDNQEQDDQTSRLFLSYPLISDLIIHTPSGDLAAELHNKAKSYALTDDRVAVIFLGATLSPADSVLSDPAQLELWKSTFVDAYIKAEKERSILSSLLRYFLRIALGLKLTTTPSFSSSDQDANEELKADNSFSFEIKRSPRGHYDVMYLDQELRISKGNRGTIVIMQRVEDGAA